ncbi:class I histocompatibility antigen, F10 alpha chain-like isoform X2 [Acanthopagrus latus]|uniref:class I histocompatibility antigen, F10 alpha chain-like isoform X2 n=1 Tax=Acanthopagrus latus TaxID=8177 RepID=UPI00187BC96C|nr:class I histocompatibility antigen, F10 alpha chain-like isoform X2 [Acanthopagrus latus]
MRTLLLLLLFCHVSSPVLHSMKHILTGSVSAGFPNLSQVVVTVEVDELLVVSCYSSKRICCLLDLKHDIAKSFFMNYPERLKWYKEQCDQLLSNFKAYINILTTLYNQTGGVHVLQEVNGIEWDDETDEVKGFSQLGYDREDFLALDPNTFTWNALRPEAVIAKPIWDASKVIREFYETALTQIYPEWLKWYVKYWRSVLLRTELPSVSLLQKTPSSPVSCLATGFYPHRASLVWRKDGEELHEEVDHGEILPNHDGTFQMSVDLNLSSVTPEAWTRYDCVFQLAGVKEEIITRLEEDRIRTNWVKPSNMTVLVTAAVVVLALILIGAAGFIVYKKMKDTCLQHDTMAAAAALDGQTVSQTDRPLLVSARCPPCAPDNSSQLSERLNEDS